MSAAGPTLTETEFAAMVTSLAQDSNRRAELVDFLREDHSCYEERGAAAVVRMRGWVLLALARKPVPQGTLPFILEELDVGLDLYLVAAAARALRSFEPPLSEFAPFVVRALSNAIRRDEPLCLEEYGFYAVGGGGPTAVSEFLDTLEWLGPAASGSLSEIRALRGSFPTKLLPQLDRVMAVIGAAGTPEASQCCGLPSGLGGWLPWERKPQVSNDPADTVIFEDHEGSRASFGQMFSEKPSIVIFFYTRCDNPLKCSLSVTKLGRIQKILEERALTDRIRTAAITYDPAFDAPERMRSYGTRRGMQLSRDHRMLRATEGMGVIRRRFRLGVNFIESLVNRHRIELYVLDDRGRIAYSFERLRWDEREVVNRTVELLTETSPAVSPPEPPARKAAPMLLGSFASLGLALFPKCPVCWASYLSLFGIAGLVPYSPWLQPWLFGALLVNLLSAWLRARATGRLFGALLASGGAVAIGLSLAGWTAAATAGVLLTMGGSLLSAFSVPKNPVEMMSEARPR